MKKIRKECEIHVDEWVERLFSRLSEKLCIRVSYLRDDGAVFEAVKKELLKPVSETTITFGHNIFQLMGVLEG